MLAFVMPKKRLDILIGLLFGVILSSIAYFWIGAANPGAQVFGVRISQPARVIPARSWGDGLREAADRHGLKDWAIEPFTSEAGIIDGQAYYLATIQGYRDGEFVTAQVELRAGHGLEYEEVKWSEQ